MRACTEEWEEKLPFGWYFLSLSLARNFFILVPLPGSLIKLGAYHWIPDFHILQLWNLVLSPPPPFRPTIREHYWTRKVGDVNLFSVSNVWEALINLIGSTFIYFYYIGPFCHFARLWTYWIPRASCSSPQTASMNSQMPARELLFKGTCSFVQIG